MADRDIAAFGLFPNQSSLERGEHVATSAEARADYHP